MPGIIAEYNNWGWSITKHSQCLDQAVTDSGTATLPELPGDRNPLTGSGPVVTSLRYQPENRSADSPATGSQSLPTAHVRPGLAWIACHRESNSLPVSSDRDTLSPALDLTWCRRKFPNRTPRQWRDKPALVSTAPLNRFVKRTLPHNAFSDLPRTVSVHHYSRIPL